jgi:hypothetical protein
VKDPFFVGLHATLTLQLARGPKVLPQVLLVITKPDVTEMLENVRMSSSSWFLTVSVCEALVVPTVTLPKLSDEGLPSSGSVSFANARLAFARPSSRRRAKLKTENVKMDDFERDMINPPEKSP